MWSLLKLSSSTKRGDTLIEVMFAIGVFALVAIISVNVMNSGVNNAERDLEFVTARNELNAQAEALRFIHSSYISEKTLPTCTPEIINGGHKCQQYEQLWKKITDNAVTPLDAEKSGLLSVGDLGSCDAIYDVSGTASSSPLRQVNAFVINTRKLISDNLDASYVGINQQSNRFVPSDLNSRIVFTSNYGNSDDQLTDGTADEKGNYALYDQIGQVEGIWDFVVKDADDNAEGRVPKYYDFYIQTCWYGPRSTSPTILDTVIRLYNPENV